MHVSGDGPQDYIFRGVCFYCNGIFRHWLCKATQLYTRMKLSWEVPPAPWDPITSLRPFNILAFSLLFWRPSFFEAKLKRWQYGTWWNIAILSEKIELKNLLQMLRVYTRNSVYLLIIHFAKGKQPSNLLGIQWITILALVYVIT